MRLASNTTWEQAGNRCIPASTRVPQSVGPFRLPFGFLRALTGPPLPGKRLPHIPHRIGQGRVLATWVGCRCTPDSLDRIVVAEVVLPTGWVVKVSRVD